MRFQRLLVPVLLLMVASAVAAADDQVGLPDLASMTNPKATAWTAPLMPIFDSAAKQYNVPLPLLLTLGYFGSAFENRYGAPTIEGGYGVMALRDNKTGGNSLIAGASLMSSSTESLQLDPALKTVAGVFCRGGAGWRAFDTIKVTRAEWTYFGISHVDHLYCNCENVRFDVDPFGRVWYPDLGRYRVGVLDTGGNLITTFGGYGNAESAGPDSPVVDPKTGKVRPRQADDPKDLKSPFAEPEIAFSYLIGVGATDKYAYMGDSMNRRLLRAKLVYAAEETVAAP